MFTIHRFETADGLAELRDQRAVWDEQRRRTLNQELERRNRAVRDMEGMRAVWKDASEENERLYDQVADLENRLKEADSRTRWLEGERRRLSLRLAESQERAETGEFPVAFEPASVEEAVDNSREFLEEWLLFLPSAFDSARKSPYKRPTEVSRALEALGDLARDMQAGVVNRPIIEYMRERKIDYRSGVSETTSKVQRKQYQFYHDGSIYVCEEHICLGVSRDPSECLRIYLTTKQLLVEGKIVIGHVGRHLDVRTTN